MRHDVRGQGLLGLAFWRRQDERAKQHARTSAPGRAGRSSARQCASSRLEGANSRREERCNQGDGRFKVRFRRSLGRRGLFAEQRRPPNGQRDPAARSSPSKPESDPPLPSTAGIFHMHFVRLHMDLGLPRCKHVPTCHKQSSPISVCSYIRAWTPSMAIDRKTPRAASQRPSLSKAPKTDV